VPGRTARGARLGSIRGVVPSLVGEVTGCAFRERCDLARAECARAIPWRETADGHGVRCVIPPAAAGEAA
jgi:peptide/nickel transport system ATP-binding protein